MSLFDWDAAATEYVIDDTDQFNSITIRRQKQRDASIKWAVCDGGLVLTKDLEWIWQPRPSSRDEAFLEKARFSSREEALKAYTFWKRTSETLAEIALWDVCVGDGLEEERNDERFGSGGWGEPLDA